MDYGEPLVNLVVLASGYGSILLHCGKAPVVTGHSDTGASANLLVTKVSEVYHDRFSSTIVYEGSHCGLSLTLECSASPCVPTTHIP